MPNFQNKIEKNKKGVQRYTGFYDKFIKSENRLSLNGKNNNKNNGGTKEIEIGEINKLLKIGHLYFKREDENETGSLKDRSLVYRISLNFTLSKAEIFFCYRYSSLRRSQEWIVPPDKFYRCAKMHRYAKHSVTGARKCLFPEFRF